MSSTSGAPPPEVYGIAAKVAPAVPSQRRAYQGPSRKLPVVDNEEPDRDIGEIFDTSPAVRSRCHGVSGMLVRSWHVRYRHRRDVVGFI